MAIRETISKDDGGLFTPPHYDIHVHDDKNNICVHREGPTVEDARERVWGEYAEKVSDSGGSGGGSGK